MNTSDRPAFFNRELSQMAFIRRVFHEACRKDSPLLERLRFLGLAAENCNEFFMLRVAALKRQMTERPASRDSAGLTPTEGLTPPEQLALISRQARGLIQEITRCLNHDLLPALAAQGYPYVPAARFDLTQKLFAERYFNQEIFPLLTPLRIEPGAFPHTANLSLHAAFRLSLIPGVTPPENQGELFDAPQVAIAQFPPSLSRVVRLPSQENAFTLLEDIITTWGTQLFPGYRVEETLIFRIIRAADFEVDEEAGKQFLNAMEEVLV
jgi:polyphosphate kinase